MGVFRQAWGGSMLEHKHRVVAEAEEEVASVEIAIIDATIEIEELGQVGGDGLAVGGRNDDHGAVAFALLCAVRIPGVVAADGGDALPAGLAEVAVHAGGKRAGRAVAGRPVAVFVGVDLERAGKYAEIVGDGGGAGLEVGFLQRRHRERRQDTDDKDDDRKFYEREAAFAEATAGRAVVNA